MATGSSLGVGRVLIAIYAVFAVSATARASYQLITKYEQAPLAYSLSALSAAIYIFATFALVKTSGRWPILAKAAIYTELVGVLVVGLMSYLVPDLFGHPSVWSKFGQGYGYIPLVLPILGLVWISKRKAS